MMCNSCLKIPALLFLSVCVLTSVSLGQRRQRDTIPAANINISPPPGMFSQIRTGPKPYKDVITNKAISSKGLFNIHKVEDKWYVEIGDSLLGRDILVVNRLSKAAAGMRNVFYGYAGDDRWIW